VELGHVVVGRHLVAVVIAALLQQLLQVLKVLCRRKSNIFLKAFYLVGIACSLFKHNHMEPNKKNNLLKMFFDDIQ
jgi:uncharacterized protein with PQ loop repeat